MGFIRLGNGTFGLFKINRDSVTFRDRFDFGALVFLRGVDFAFTGIAGV